MTNSQLECTHSTPRNAGFSLVELVAALTLSIVLLYALHSTLRSSISARQTSDRVYRVNQMAEQFVHRLRQIPFGKPSDGVATGGQLSGLFASTLSAGTTTLHQVKVAHDQPGHSFVTTGNGVNGTYRIKVSSDLDGDSALSGAREGRDDLLRIEVWFNDRMLAATLRAAEPSETTKDTTANYLGG